MRYILSLLTAAFCFASIGSALTSVSIPRIPTQTYFNSGLFKGGKNVSAHLERIRLAAHPDKGFERWVIDFSDLQTQTIGSVAPKFLLEYVPSRETLGNAGVNVKSTPKFIFRFQSVDQVRVTQSKLHRLLKRSHFVKNITIFPQIENGDLAMEFDLVTDVQFEPHQPIEREGRLVLDLKLDQTPLTP